MGGARQTRHQDGDVHRAQPIWGPAMMMGYVRHRSAYLGLPERTPPILRNTNNILVGPRKDHPARNAKPEKPDRRTPTPTHTRSEPPNDARQCVSSPRPPARPAGSGPRKILHHPPLVTRTLRTAPSPAPVKIQPPKPGVAVAWGARGVDKPEGIRREPKADEDDDGAVRSEGSGPQSLTRAPQATATPGVKRTPHPASIPTQIPQPKILKNPQQYPHISKNR